MGLMFNFALITFIRKYLFYPVLSGRGIWANGWYLHDGLRPSFCSVAPSGLSFYKG